MKQRRIKGAAANKPLRPRGRPRAASEEARREQIIESALDVFLELGYAGTTTDIVAARCGISKRTLYEVFSSKTELFQAVIVAHRRTMLDLPCDHDDRPFADALASIFWIDIQPKLERRRRAFIHLVMTEIRQFPEIGAMLRRDGVEESRRLLADWLTLERDRGVIASDDVRSDAGMLMDMIFGGLAIRPRGPPKRLDRNQRRNYIRRCIDVFLNGVSPRFRGE
jgi:TetR/AcrR family transcriptional repressor of mexJK operon